MRFPRLPIVLLACFAAMPETPLAGPLRAQGAFVRSGRIVPLADAAARLDRINLPRPPDWDAEGNAATWTIDDIRLEFARATDTPPQINFVQTSFLRPSQAWMNSYRDWYLKLEKPLGMQFVESLWDCDDYASCFVTFADLLALRAGETRAPFCIGWASVYNRRPFAGVEPGGMHAVVIIGTAEGFFVIEPQNGTLVPLRRYPNRDTIDAVYF